MEDLQAGVDQIKLYLAHTHTHTHTKTDLSASRQYIKSVRGSHKSTILSKAMDSTTIALIQNKAQQISVQNKCTAIGCLRQMHVRKKIKIKHSKIYMHVRK